MSLINDALKKAQRMRAAPAPADQAAGQPSARIEKRGRPMRAQTTILLVAGAVVLIVFSVVLTAYWFSRPTPPTKPVASVPAKPAPVDPDRPAPTIVVPIPAPVVVEKAPEETAAPTPKPVAPAPVAPPPQSAPPSTATSVAAETAPSPSAPAPIAAQPQSNPSNSLTTPVPPAPAAAAPAPSPAASNGAGVPDSRIQIYVDHLRVTGIRSSGTDSKVLMNDRVYRINDVVDRALGVKLVKVESDRLTFTDPAGVIYTKTF